MPDQLLYAMEVTLNGLMAGVMYALVALGFVLIYKASGIFNYAQGVLALFAALTLVGIGLMVFWRIRGDVRHATPHPFFVTPGLFDDEFEDDELEEAGDRDGDDHSEGGLGGVTDAHEGSSASPGSV